MLWSVAVTVDRFLKGPSMTLRKTAAVCGLCLMLIGCNGGNSAGDGGLSAYVVQEMVRPLGDQYKFVRGAFSRMVLAIENDSDDLIVLRGCSVAGQLPDIDRWHGSRYGLAQYRPFEDVWVYNEMAQQLSEPVFAMGVISPHDSIEVVRWIRLERESVEIDVAYQRLSAEDAAEHLYVETAVDGRFSMERVFMHPDSLVRRGDSRVNTNWQVVIFPRAQEFSINGVSLRCSVSFQEPPISIDAVRAAIGDEIRESVYWKSQGKWVVRTDRGSFVVDGQGRRRLGDVDLLSFGVIASSYKEVDCILPLKGYEEFDLQGPKIGEGGFFDAGVTKVEHGDILRLLDSARDNGDSMTVLPYDGNGLGMEFYLLVGEFDEAARREIAER